MIAARFGCTQMARPGTRKREFYEKPTQERKRKAAAAVKRQSRRTSRDVTKRQRLY